MEKKQEDKELITVDTDLGTISVSKSVIRSMILEIIDSFDGKVILSNPKGKIPKFPYYIGTPNDAEQIEIELTEVGLQIRVHVILKFGTSIKRTTRLIIDEIRSTVKERTGVSINKVTILVTGMMSKKIAPRHIEVNG